MPEREYQEFDHSAFSPEEEEIREKLQTEDWRMGCPRGHTTLFLNRVPTVYCQMCGQAYEYDELVDRAVNG